MAEDGISAADGIGTESTLADLRLPPHVGEHLATLFGRSERFETGGEWVTAMRTAFDARDGDGPTEADLCHDDDGLHRVEVGDETSSYVCVLDPLVVPFLRGEAGTVESTSPVDGATVTFEITADGVTVDPADAVVSLGVARDAGGDGPVSNERIYEETCPYIHAFASVEEYERWAAETDAAATSLDAREGVAVARGLARELFDAEAAGIDGSASDRSRCECGPR